ncbi:NAD(P)H-dependent oxidoreductase subunit E [Miniphocaeibacter halophilus]|uniref:NAD(P)H-dependent oxidoreductase subunit E n=1 Tax=Miniphocaeibacter halophilus TaxID=2931922 RepID=A0AC61MT88_9FIRM|nr:NAD(P)H-dependent oxidoreductase subunit E [Miniphocaeibacter halophilus]QQK08717.1 NAD(P)H-dependent oxidoreductase subunit E [Miniphocaeibacter halophilus]
MKIEICVGSSCTMMSAMNILDYFEDWAENMRERAEEAEVEIEEIEVIPIKCRRNCKGAYDASPVVYINGEIIENANNDKILEEIFKVYDFKGLM